MGATALLAACSAACSNSSTAASATVQGTIGGSQVDTLDVYGTNATIGSDTTAITTVNVSIANRAGICGDVMAGTRPANLRLLSFAVTTQGSSTPTGQYAIGQQGTDTTTSARYEVLDGACHATNDFATAGSVTFTTIDSGVLRGSFDLTFPDGHVTGDFTAPVCNASADGMTCTQ